MLLEHERNYGLGMDAAGPLMLLEHETEFWFGHGCSGDRMLLERKRNYGLGMDALVIACSCNTNGIMVWASLYSARRGVGGLNPKSYTLNPKPYIPNPKQLPKILGQSLGPSSPFRAACRKV